ncbi:MAG: glycosyltransferase [Bacteroidota bacterium]|nr:glycosyltransferase [Bacteroidota bacterium]MDP3144480.1 glycosyltransferase [Bacteroidota bacterium]
MEFEGLSIIIPTKDRGDVFVKTLTAAYNAITNISAEILIINDSKINNPIIPKDFNDKVKLINNPKSGVASARNLGAINSKFSNLLFLDDDILISEKNIFDLIQNIQQFPNSAINFNWLYPLELTENIQKTKFGRYLIENEFTSLKGWNKNLKWEGKSVFELDLVASYFLSINKENFNLIGGYNESFPHAGAEDFEFASRLKKSNIKGLCNPSIIVWHNEEDRVALLPWLQRKERSAETRKIAVSLGYPEMAIIASVFKIKFALFLYQIKSTFIFALKLIPNNKLFDHLSFKIINMLLAIYLYKGFFKTK